MTCFWPVEESKDNYITQDINIFLARSLCPLAALMKQEIMGGRRTWQGIRGSLWPATNKEPKMASPWQPTRHGGFPPHPPRPTVCQERNAADYHLGLGTESSLAEHADENLARANTLIAALFDDIFPSNNSSQSIVTLLITPLSIQLILFTQVFKVSFLPLSLLKY